MTDVKKTKAQLINELEALRAQVAALERAEAEHQTTREALHRERNLLDRLVATSPAGIAVVDREGQITFANDHAERVLGLARDEIVQRTYNAPAWHITDYEGNPFPDEELPFRRVMATGQPVYDVRHAIEWPDGQRVLLTINAAPLFDESGQFDGMVATVEDITKRKQAERALEESEEKFRTLADQSPNMVFINKKGRVVYANRRCEELTGYTRDEFYAPDFDFMQLITPEYHEPISSNFARHMRGEDVAAIDYAIVAKEGHQVEVILASKLIDYEGEKAILGVVTDITEHKRAEETLAAARQRLAYILRGTNVGTWEWNVQTGETTFNERWAEIIGYTLEEISPVSIDTWIKFAHPDDLKVSDTLLEKHFKGELEYYECEARMRHKNGDWVWVLDRGKVATWTEDGKPLLMFGTHQDITERKRMEEALRESEAKYRSLFEYSPISLWEEDFSEVKAYLDELRASGVSDLRTYFEEHPEAVDHCASIVKVIDVNQASVDLFQAGSKEALSGGLDTIFTDESLAPFGEELLALAEGDTHFVSEIAGQPRRGEPIDRIVSVSVAPGYEETWAKVFVSVQDISERKRMEEALRESEWKFRSLVEQSIDGISLADEQGIVIEWNAGQEQVTGLKRAEVLGRPVWEIDALLSPEEVTPARREQLRAMALEFLKSGRGDWTDRLREQEIQRPDGMLRTIQGFIFPIKTDKGFMAASINRDITVSRRAEEVLRRQSEKLEALHRVTLDITTELDLDALLQALIKSALTLIEATSGGLYLYRPERDVIEWTVAVGDRVAPIGVELKRGEGVSGKVWEGGRPLIVDNYAQWPGRADIYDDYDWGAVLAAPIYWGDEFLGVIDATADAPRAFSDADADLLTLFAAQAAIAIKNARLFDETRRHAEELEERVAERTAELTALNKQLRREITERKLVEAALRESEQRFRSIFDHAPFGISIVSKDFKPLHTNRAHEKIFGYAESETLSMGVLDYTHPDDLEASRRLMDVLRNGEASFGQLEKRYYRKDGGLVWAQVAISVVQGADDEPQYYIAMIEDITERKQAEHDLKAAYERLKELDYLKDEFVANVSHELRTPLANIKLYHHLLSVRPDHHDTYLDTLTRETIRLELIVEDLLYLSRIDQGRMPFKPEPVELNALASQFVADHVLLAKDKELVLTFAGEADLPPVEADPHLLERVLSILLNNALGYTPRGGRVEIYTCTRREDDGPWVGLCVSDDGPGIPPEEHERLFERFFRGQMAIASGHPGTGLGLAIAQEIVSRHGGHVTVESEGVPGKGSKFTVWLPVEE